LPDDDFMKKDETCITFYISEVVF